eukprot:385312-Hanusia_phi.AAC.2
MLSVGSGEDEVKSSIGLGRRDDGTRRCITGAEVGAVHPFVPGVSRRILDERVLQNEVDKKDDRRCLTHSCAAGGFFQQRRHEDRIDCEDRGGTERYIEFFDLLVAE